MWLEGGRCDGRKKRSKKEGRKRNGFDVPSAWVRALRHMGAGGVTSRQRLKG